MRTRALAPAVEVGLCFLLAAGAAAARAGDWPQWGGGPGRNMASHERDLPDSFDPAVPQTAPAEPPATLPSPGRNVKWVFPTGVRTNGSPVVARGRVIIGSGLKEFFPDKRRSQERGCGRLLCLDEQTGRLVAQDDEKVGTRVLKGQWSSPALCKLADRELIIYGAGDGFCYAFKPAAAAADGPVATLEKVWAADCNPPEFRSRDGKPIGYMRKGKEGPCEIIATPVCRKGRVYVPIGREPVYGPGAGCLSCINGADGRVLWRSTQVGRSLSTVAIADGRLYAADLSGMLHCLDPDTGRHHWKHRVGRAVWASPHVADYKAYVATTSGLTVMPLGETPLPTRPIGLRNIAATPCTANGVLYVASQQYLYAVCREEKESEK